jgi:hypothetical protein
VLRKRVDRMALFLYNLISRSLRIVLTGRYTRPAGAGLGPTPHLSTGSDGGNQRRQPIRVPRMVAARLASHVWRAPGWNLAAASAKVTIGPQPPGPLEWPGGSPRPSKSVVETLPTLAAEG